MGSQRMPARVSFATGGAGEGPVAVPGLHVVLHVVLPRLGKVAEGAAPDPARLGHQAFDLFFQGFNIFA